MQRITSTPRANWVRRVEEHGLIYHHTNEGVYWDESSFYQLSSRQVDQLEAATNELQRICLDAAQHVIDANRFAEFGIPPTVVDAIVWAWNQEPPAIYGRFDLAYDGRGEPKLLEYNADTPTGLLEAAVVQWYWLQDVHKGTDQFNSIHEKLVAKWKELKDYTTEPIYFAAAEDVQAEDMMTVTYLRDTAQEGGVTTLPILIKDIGWHQDSREFVDLQNRPMKTIFKLYPWEWLVHEDFGVHLLETYRTTQWMEPIWKMLWSNKAILAILWELFPNHPNLLPAYLNNPHSMSDYVRKPKMSREGANIQLVQGGDVVLETPGDYGEEGYVFQALAKLPTFDGNVPIVGSWVVDGVSCGIGIRESNGRITTNTSRFVPHLFT